MQNLKKQFDELITYSLFNSDVLNDEYKELLDKLTKKLESSNNIIKDINTLISNSTQNNRYLYLKYINDLLTNTKLSYEQIISSLNNETFNKSIFNKLSSKDFLYYLDNEVINIDLVNNYIKNNIKIEKELPKHCKNIKSNSLDLIYYKDLNKYISEDFLEKCTNNFITTYILNNYKDFNKFSEYIINNKEIANKIKNNSLIFNQKYDKQIIDFINNHLELSQLFDNKYISELNPYVLYKKGIINSYILGNLIKSGYDIKEIFSIKNINLCDNNLIDYPINNLDYNTIINDYSLLNKFNEYRIVEYINSLTEEERINILRNNEFINNMSDYVIELIVNNLSFKSLFNMIQNHNIVDRINNINSQINSNDLVFITGFLDSTLLVYKSNHNMLFNMLNHIPNTLDYLELPYIYTKLTSDDIINIINNKCNNFNEVIENNNLFNKLSSSSIANYINTKKDKEFLELVSNKKVLKKLFNISDDLLDNINIEEVNYLFETIRTKDILSIQDKNYTVLTYRALLASYLCFGIKDTLNIIINGNKDLDINSIKSEIDKITYNNLIEYRKNNYSLLQNTDKKIAYNLKNAPIDKDLFKKYIFENGYLNSIITFMVKTNYSSLSELISMLYTYKLYEDNIESRKELNNYCNSFSNYLINKKRIQTKSKLENIAKNESSLKRSIKSKEYKNISNEYWKLFRLKIFINVLTGDYEDYKYAFRNDYDLKNIKEKYTEYLGIDLLDLDNIINYILVPLTKGKFNKYNCLEKLNIIKPKDYDLYLRNIEDINTVNEINQYISSLNYNENTIIEILNNICYESPITNKISVKDKHTIKKLQYKAYEILGEIYIDKSTLKIIYTNTIDIDNEEQIINYLNYLNIIEKIINKTFNYINRHMLLNNIKSQHINTYLNNIAVDENKYSYNNKNYELKQRIFALKDIEKIFNGFTFDKEPIINNNLYNLLFNQNLIKYVGINLYKDEIDNLGYIISNWDTIEKKINDSNIDIKELDIFDIKKIISNTNKNNISSKILLNIYSDTYFYDIPKVEDRIDLISKIIDEALLKTCSTIPMIGVSNEEYSLSILDYQDDNNYLISFNSDYKIGSSNSDLLTYSLLSNNGCVLVVKDTDNNIIGRINGIRVGNALFLSTPITNKDIDIKVLLIEFSENIVSYTKDTIEPIEIIVINNYNYGINIDSSTYEYINTPININCYEYKYLLNKGLLIGNDINMSFSGNTSILYSSIPIDKNSFKNYEPSITYDRIRNNITIINGLANEDIIKNINNIIYRYKKLNNEEDYHNIDIDAYKTIYLSNDYVILINHNNEISTYILPFDSRTNLEVNTILNNITNKKSLN